MLPGMPRGPSPSVVATVTPEALAAELAAGQRVVLLDVREPLEVAEGTIAGARVAPRGALVAATLGIEKFEPVVTLCASGARSLMAASALAAIGFSSVRSLEGGTVAWRAAGLPLVVPDTPAAHRGSLSAEETARYARQLRLAEVGPTGQEKLRRARVLVVGLGGLGSPAALYLAAAGVGTLGLVDGDAVEVSNLQRQIAHTTPRIGQKKTDSAGDAIGQLNPHVAVEPHALRLDRANAAALVGDYDVIVDGSDNFSTRFLVADACVLHGKPLVHGAVNRFEGEVSVFFAERGPCYRCLHRAAPPPDLAPSCDAVGVLGVVPGLVGVLQATEALKWILGVGEPLVGRVLYLDALTASFRAIRLAPDPACPTCSARR